MIFFLKLSYRLSGMMEKKILNRMDILKDSFEKIYAASIFILLFELIYKEFILNMNDYLFIRFGVV